MNWATLKGLTIPEGVVTKISNGISTLWELLTLESKPAILEVKKITSDTYAGETTYASEEFILLDVYPKTSSSTVNVTYGGLTKTLTFSGTNSQKVFFGTFNGVSDSVTTPASGTLTIDGDYSAYAYGTYKVYENSKSSTKYCQCITAITDFGTPNHIP